MFDRDFIVLAPAPPTGGPTTTTAATEPGETFGKVEAPNTRGYAARVGAACGCRTSRA